MNVPVKNKRGFTLIEIVVVIGIMAILTIIVYGSFGGARTQSRDQQRVADINTIQLGLETYYNQYHKYPTDLSDPLLSQFISSIPTPPSGGSYNYFPITPNTSTGPQICTTYQLWTTFEKSNGYLDSKKGFNSVTMTGMYDCGGGHTTAVDSSLSNPNATLIYDVMPQ